MPHATRRARELADAVSARLAAAADPAAAGPMQAYMKTDMPFYGVKKPGRLPVIRLMRDFPLDDQAEYEAAVLELWSRPHREEKYLALRLADQRRRFITAASLPLYERLVREGQWWDLVDLIAVHLIGRVWLADRDAVSPLADAWIDDRDLWMRRTALIGQARHKEDTDAPRLFAFCRRRMREKEFFIRKAIGWALREYSYFDPDAVARFLLSHKEDLSGLSFREGAKQLRRQGVAPFAD